MRDYGIGKNQLGLEPTFDLYIKHLCDIFDEVKRVLRNDGTIWINLSDTYTTIENEKRMLSEKDRAWLACLIETDGYIGIHKQERENIVPSYQAHISVAMKRRELVDYALKITGIGVVREEKSSGRCKGEIVYAWRVRGNGAKKIIEEIYDELKLKKKQATLLLMLVSHIQKYKKGHGKYRSSEELEYREELLQKIKKLNKNKIINIPNIKIKREKTIVYKTLAGIPERFKLEMIKKGWACRNTIIWHKKNCMPSSIKDRFTVDFEYLFFFSKKKKYYFEQQFESQKAESYDRLNRGISNNHKNLNVPGQTTHGMHKSRIQGQAEYLWNEQGRNKRTVWTINPKPFSEAHFAVYPEELCETPIKAGCPVGGIVYDPFAGSGTTGLVAYRLNRQYILSEMKKEYCEIAEKRLSITKQIQFA